VFPVLRNERGCECVATISVQGAHASDVADEMSLSHETGHNRLGQHWLAPVAQPRCVGQVGRDDAAGGGPE